MPVWFYAQEEIVKREICEILKKKRENIDWLRVWRQWHGIRNKSRNASLGKEGPMSLSDKVREEEKKWRWRNFKSCRQLLYFSDEKAKAQRVLVMITSQWRKWEKVGESGRQPESQCLFCSAASLPHRPYVRRPCCQNSKLKCSQRFLSTLPLIYFSSHHPISSFPNAIFNRYYPAINPFLPPLVLERPASSANFTLYL